MFGVPAQGVTVTFTILTTEEPTAAAVTTLENDIIASLNGITIDGTIVDTGDITFHVIAGSM